MAPVKLGRKYDSPCCAPVSDSKSQVCYPSVYLENIKTALPHGGTITFRFKANSITENVKKEKIDASLDLLEIVDIVADKGEEKAKSPADVLDELAGAKKKTEKTEPDYLAEDEE